MDVDVSPLFDEREDGTEFDLNDEAMSDEEIIPERIIKAFPSVADIKSWNAAAIINWVNSIFPGHITKDDRRILEKNNFDGYGFLLDDSWHGQIGISNAAKYCLKGLARDIQIMPPEAIDEAREVTIRHEVVLRQLNSTFKDGSDALNKLSNPEEYIELPFPSSMHKPSRFDGDEKRTFHFMGREIFHDLVIAAQNLDITITDHELRVYGTKGHGKSHLLAALMCYMSFLNRRVIFIPDAWAAIHDLVSTVRKALLFAWANSRQKVQQIMMLNDPQAMTSFIKSNRRDENGKRVIFIMDQMNALQSNANDNEPLRQNANTWVSNCLLTLRAITSSSANYQSFIITYAKQQPHRAFSCYGGLTEVEMKCWWRNHVVNNWGPYKKEQIEDLTGRIPLLLVNCVNEKKEITLDPLQYVWDEILGFAKEHRDTYRDKDYRNYVKACIAGKKLNKGGINMKFIDHRYLIYKDVKRKYEGGTEKTVVVGECICGIARDAWAQALRNLDDPGFDISDVVSIMEKHASNSSMLGFLVEQGIITTILDTGLPLEGCRGQGFKQRTFTEYPSYTLSSPENAPFSNFLFVPNTFNYPVLDCLMLVIQHRPRRGASNDGSLSARGKAILRPIQITTARYHRFSEEEFFNHLPEWQRGLEEYEVDVEFIWISLDPPTTREVPERIKRMRNREITVNPNYKSRKIHLLEVNKKLWAGLLGTSSGQKRILEQESAAKVQDIIEFTTDKRRKS